MSAFSPRPARAAVRRSVLASGILAASLAAAAQTPAARPADPPGALPLDLAFSRKHLEPFFVEQAALSRDGRLLAYVVVEPPPRSAGSELEEEPRVMPNGTPASSVGMRLNVAETQKTGTDRAVCAANQNCWRGSWSPDGKLLAYYSDSGGVPQLYVYDVASRQSRRVSDVKIKAKLWPGDEAAWSPDGRELYVPVNLAADAPAALSPKAARASGKPTVTVYQTDAQQAPPAGETPAAMMEHFIRENNATLAAVELASGKMRVLVPAETEPRASCLRLSPDGKWISYLSVFKMKGETASESYFDLAIVPVAGGKPWTVAADLTPNEDGSYFGASYRWRPASTEIVFLKGKRLWVADILKRMAPRPLGADLGDLTDEPLLLTADGKAVLVGVKDTGEQTYYYVPPKALALVPVDGGAPKVFAMTGTPVPSGPDALWQPSAGTFLLMQDDKKTGERVLVRVDAASGAGSGVWRGPGRFAFVGAAAGGAGLVAQFESVATPPDFYRFDPTFASRERISHVEPRLDAVAVGPMKTFSTPIPGFNGKMTSAQSAIYLPSGWKEGDRRPTIVYFYGGSQLGERAQSYGGGAPNSIPVQVFATRGYAVLVVDVPLGPEGPSGGNPIQEMAEAILPQVYHAAALGYTDSTRVAIMGQSYGGYGTAAMVTQTNLFRAAMALDGVYDLPGEYARMDKGGGTFNFVWSETGQGRMGTHPWADLKRYLANSPYYQADKIHTPLLLVHGKNDTTCRVEGAEKLYNALKRLKRTSELAIYDGEGHVPGDWSLVNAVDASDRMLAFLQKHMGAEKVAAAP